MIKLIARTIIVVFVLAALLLILSTPVESAGRPKPCVGVVVRVINPGVEVVRRKDGSTCTRPAQQPVTKPRKVK